MSAQTGLTAEQARGLKPGDTVIYHDGRPEHRRVSAGVVTVGQSAMVVQFEDRARRTAIAFSARAWMDYLEQVHVCKECGDELKAGEWLESRSLAFSRAILCPTCGMDQEAPEWMRGER